jgi:ribosome maturation protein SDO1
MDEVLQVASVFTSVSKGVLAKSEELKKAFGTDDTRKCCMNILEHGELQVSEQERKSLLEQTFKDIATIIAEKCVNPDTGRPYPAGIIERAMHDAHYSVHPAKTAKQQALAVIKLLQEKGDIKIERAKMRLLLVLPVPTGPSNIKQELLDKQLVTAQDGIESEQILSQKLHLRCLIDPSFFRDVSDLVKLHGGTAEILAHNVATESSASASR